MIGKRGISVILCLVLCCYSLLSATTSENFKLSITELKQEVERSKQNLSLITKQQAVLESRLKERESDCLKFQEQLTTLKRDIDIKIQREKTNKLLWGVGGFVLGGIAAGLAMYFINK